MSRLACTHAHETLIWASKGKGARHTFNYTLINSPNPHQQLSSVWSIPTVPMAEKLHGYHPTQKPLRLVRRALLASSSGEGEGAQGAIERRTGGGWKLWSRIGGPLPGLTRFSPSRRQ